MRRLLTGLVGAFGLATLWRLLRRGRAAGEPESEPASELRRRLAEAREATDDRDEFDAAEGVPVDQAEALTGGELPGGESRSIDERRRDVHEQAQEALGRMHQQRDD